MFQHPFPTATQRRRTRGTQTEQTSASINAAETLAYVNKRRLRCCLAVVGETLSFLNQAAKAPAPEMGASLCCLCLSPRFVFIYGCILLRAFPYAGSVMSERKKELDTEVMVKALTLWSSPLRVWLCWGEQGINATPGLGVLNPTGAASPTLRPHVLTAL